MSEEKTVRKIAYYPEGDKNNAYVERMQELLSVYGTIETVPGIKRAMLKALKGDFSTYDVIWFNFIENEFVGRDGRLNLKKTLKIIIKTLFITQLARKSVFVRHNHYPHATHPDHTRRVKKVIDWYERLFDTVVTHSGAEVNKRKMYCPHPLYILEPIEKAPVLDYSLPDEYFVVFGRIVRYKKIERLIESFPENKTLLIIGSVGDKLYASELMDLVKDRPNIIYKPGYVADDVAQYLISKSQGVIISHADDDMVVSGTFFYAMSINKKVFAVDTTFLRWVHPIVGENLLHMENSLPSLCDAIKYYNSNNKEINPQIIIESFGDDAVIKCIDLIL